jgi:hypothetical protein
MLGHRLHSKVNFPFKIPDDEDTPNLQAFKYLRFAKSSALLEKSGKDCMHGGKLVRPSHRAKMFGLRAIASPHVMGLVIFRAAILDFFRRVTTSSQTMPFSRNA